MFQDFGKKFADAAKAVSKRTSEATELMRLNSRISGIEADMEKLYTQIGRAYYAMRGGEAESDTTGVLCDMVDSLKAQVASLKAESDRLRNVNRCPVCGAEQDAEASFCSNCGNKLPKLEKKPPEEERAQAEPEPEAVDQPVQGGREVEITWPEANGGESDRFDGQDDKPQQTQEDGPRRDEGLF